MDDSAIISVAITSLRSTLIDSLDTLLHACVFYAQGCDPELTNFALTRDATEPVAGTLDYVWYSKGLCATAVVPVPPKAALPGPLPAGTEPSDHLMVGATFTVL